MSKKPKGVETRVVNILEPAVLWALAVKVRDNDRCAVCESKDEAATVLIPGFDSISTEDGRLNLDSGITLCAKCRVLADTDPKFRNSLKDCVKPQPMMRLNCEIDRTLYSKFSALCRIRGMSISRAIRSFIQEQIDEVEDGTKN